MAQDDIYLIINRYLAGEITEEDEQVLDSWLKESDENRNQLSRLTKIWEASGNLSMQLDIDHDIAWVNIEQKTHSAAKGWSYYMSSTYMKVAASILLLFSIGGLFFLLTPESKIVHQTASKERIEIMLPDSSRVWLNQHSELSYHEDFATNRTLSLKGEAYFEVTHNATRPFTVQSLSINTTVLGTSFSVNDYQDNIQSEVVVATGRVKVSPANQSMDGVLLEAGTSAVYERSSNELVKSTNSDPNFLAWKDRNLRFENTKFDEIETVLENYFDIEIAMDNEQIGSCQFTGTFHNPTLEEVLQVISVALDINHSIQDGVYRFSGDGC